MNNQIKPHIDEKEYTHSPENKQATLDMSMALTANDTEEIQRLATKMVLPLGLLKAVGKDFIHKYNLPITTAELANDTEWLK